jgi:hypothetical protein
VERGSGIVFHLKLNPSGFRLAAQQGGQRQGEIDACGHTAVAGRSPDSRSQIPLFIFPLVFQADSGILARSREGLPRGYPYYQDGSHPHGIESNTY